MSTRLPHVVIIGGGATGAVQLLRLTERLGSKIRLTLVDPAANIGLGRAYSTEEPQHILNVPASKMSVDPTRPDDFVEWIKANKTTSTPAWPFVPRAWFGAYLHGKVAALTNFGHVRHRATRLRQKRQGWQIDLDDDTRLSADMVIMASGYQSHANKAVAKPADATAAAWILGPTDQSALAALPPGARIVVVGAGLTAVDMFRQLSPRKMQFLSRHGYWPLTAATQAPAAPIVLPDLDQMSPRQILQILRSFQKATHETWSNLADSVRPQVQAIWSSWTSEEKSQFGRHLKVFWEIGRHRVPPSVGADLQAATATGQVEVLAGRIRCTRREGDHLVVEYQPRGSKQIETLTCDRMILAIDTKIETDLLAQSGLKGLKPCPLSFGFVNLAVPRLWLVGPTAKATHFETTAMREILEQSSCVAHEVGEALDNREWGSTFTHHPTSAGETYVEHFTHCAKVTGGLARAAFALTVHSVLPWLFTDRVSNDVRTLSRRLSKKHIKISRYLKRL